MECQLFMTYTVYRLYSQTTKEPHTRLLVLLSAQQLTARQNSTCTLHSDTFLERVLFTSCYTHPQAKYISRDDTAKDVPWTQPWSVNLFIQLRERISHTYICPSPKKIRTEQEITRKTKANLGTYICRAQF